MVKRNPKQEGTNLWDCRPQTGKCPLNCNQCFYNRPGAFYVDINKPNIPTPEEVGDGIVRMNCGHDSNLQRELVIEIAREYKHVFFNTSIPRFDFPGPVVYTANPMEEKLAYLLTGDEITPNLMFVRLRVSASNLKHIKSAVDWYANWCKVPVVLTFMAYYERNVLEQVLSNNQLEGWTQYDIENRAYIFKVRHINEYWCPTVKLKAYVLNKMQEIGGRLVTMCGTLYSDYCRDCRNCEFYYWQTIKFMMERTTLRNFLRQF